MAEIQYYKSNQNNKFLGTIDLSSINPSKSEQNAQLICLLDRSGSMSNNVYIYVKEIFPLILEKLKCDKQDNILITYDDEAEEYSGNAEFFKNQKISARGDNILYLGLEKLEISGEECLKTHRLICDLYEIGKRSL